MLMRGAYALRHTLENHSEYILMNRIFRLTGIIALAMSLPACASLKPGFEKPTVTISSFKALPSDGMMPAFAIGLRVVNPNPDALNLRGVSYTVSLAGNEVIKGVGNDLPVIEAYGEGEFNLTASANLFAGMRLITDLLKSNKETFAYEVEAKLDIGAFRPAIRVKDGGEISLSGASVSR